jgi:hypothetical protein
MRGANGGRYDKSTSVRVLDDVALALLWRACEPKAGLPALAQRLALLGGHWPILLEVRTETPAAPLGAAVRVTGSGVGRPTIARGRVVRSRGRRGRTSFEDATAKERLALTVLPHAAVPAQGRGAKSRVTRYGAGRGWLIAVRCDLCAREVRVAGVSNYSVGIEVTVKFVWVAAVSAPEKQPEDEDDKQAADSASDSTNKCTVTAATATSGTRYCGRHYDDCRVKGISNHFAIGSG